MSSLQKNKTDEVLWNLFQNGSKKAFEEIYRRNIQMLFHFGTRITSDHSLVKDSIQELFIDLWRRRKPGHEVRQVKVYLIKSFRYKLQRVISKAGSQKTITPEELYEQLVDESHDEEERVEQRRMQLQKSLERLSPRQREVVYLRYFQNLSNREIAEILGINYQSVSNILMRALTKMRSASKSSLIG